MIQSSENNNHVMKSISLPGNSAFINSFVIPFDFHETILLMLKILLHYIRDIGLIKE